MGSLAEVWRLVGHGQTVSWFWPVVIRICASLTHGRVIGSPSGDGVAYAGWHVGLRHCFAASAQPLTAASTLHALLLPPPVITAGRLFQRARLRNNHGANSAYLSRWPS